MTTHHTALFWLHIKKSGGLSTRALLQPHYVEVDRSKKPKNFIQAKPEEFNDILNNYRIALGNYQFKRCLFAKKFLYPDEWDDMFSFAFSREPVDRCISMFFYLFWKDRGLVRNLKFSLRKYITLRKIILNASYAFDLFLDYVEAARESDSIYTPLSNHFTTHTAPMWDDITDFNGKRLLKKVYRLESLIQGINDAFEACGIEKRLRHNEKKRNRNKWRKNYHPTQTQVKKIKKIYCRDFDIYETAQY